MVSKSIDMAESVWVRTGHVEGEFFIQIQAPAHGPCPWACPWPCPWALPMGPAHGPCLWALPMGPCPWALAHGPSPWARPMGPEHGIGPISMGADFLELQLFVGLCSKTWRSRKSDGPQSRGSLQIPPDASRCFQMPPDASQMPPDVCPGC